MIFLINKFYVQIVIEARLLGDGNSAKNTR